MRKRIRQMARGKFEYTKPVLTFSEEQISIEVIEDSDYTGDFVVNCENLPRIRGVAYSTNARMECLTPQFESEEVRIRYHFHGKGLTEGETQKGEFVIVCSQCEYSLSFCVSISKQYVDSSVGPIRTLFDFANLARENWEEAYQLFYHRCFSNIIKPKEIKEAMIYRGIAAAKPSNQNLEEFLVGIKKKERVTFSVEKSELSFAYLEASYKETISIQKSGWGYVAIELSTDAPFIELPRAQITTEDFIGNTCLYDFFIDNSKLHSGKNFGRILLRGVYGETAISVEVHQTGEGFDNRENLEIKQCRIGLMELYQAYRLKRIVTGVWAAETIEILDHLHAMVPKEPMYSLMKAQALIINRQRQEAEWILEDFKREWFDRSAPIWGYYLYLCTLMEREPAFVDRKTKEIEAIFRENPDSVMLFWVLSFLQEEYYNNHAQKLKAIEYWVMKGCASPYLYLEAFYLIWQDPYLLVKLDKFEIRILRWAIRHKALTKDISMQIFQIVEAGRNFDHVVFSLLTAAYDVNPKPGNVGIICSYLIKGQRYDKKYHKWYAQGIELELRITGLYEAFLLSMEEHAVVPVPKIIQMYFQYDNTVGYRRLAVLYHNIIESKRDCPEVYQQYRRAMGRFAMEQVEQEHMDENLACVYRDMLELGLINEEIAHALAHILYTNKLTVEDDHPVRVIVYQRQMKEVQIVPIVERFAYFQLYSDEYVILFEDEKGRRYAGSIPYRLQALMDASAFVEKCMALAPEEISYLVAYFGKKQNYLTYTPEDRRYFARMLFADELSLEYQSELAPEILKYYLLGEYDSIVKEYLEKTDFSEMSVPTRRYMTELLVENHLYEKAYGLVEEFGIDQIGSASKVALSCFLIHKLEGEEDEFLTQMIGQSFLAGKFNDEMLDYLCRYYVGPTDTMYEVWKAAKQFDLMTLELEERILIQSLYTETLLADEDALFERYCLTGGREMIVLAYLSYRAHTFFLQHVPVSPFIFERIRERYIRRQELNDACRLALLLYLSGKDTISETEYAIEDELLAEYTCRNMNFAFYKNLDRRLVMKYHFYDKMFLEYRTNPKNHVILHFSRDEDGQKFHEEDMIDVYGGIFVKPFIMFFGEMIQYYISEEGPSSVQVTESSRLANSDIYSQKDDSRYNLLNQMMIASTLMDEEALFDSMKQYAGFDEVTKKVFTLL